jgi:hypothetical protein
MTAIILGECERAEVLEKVRAEGRPHRPAEDAQPPAPVHPTRQWPTVGRTVLCFRTGGSPGEGPLPATVVRVVPDPGPHPVVQLVAFGVSPDRPAVVLPPMPLFDPLGGRTPPGHPPAWAEWVPPSAGPNAWPAG